MSVEDQLREAMKAYGTMYRVAVDAGVGHATVQGFMHGQRGLQANTFNRLCEFFGLTLWDRKTGAREVLRGYKGHQLSEAALKHFHQVLAGDISMTEFARLIANGEGDPNAKTAE